ncbi:MAG: hypothetical protein IKH15_08045 [Bacteroidales bacterium]|nr:hypothetical protein [Bacteroidales bacterium]MBR4637036.1 hypothetical protein [Bacteroidales bacterium]
MEKKEKKYVTVTTDENEIKALGKITAMWAADPKTAVPVLALSLSKAASSSEENEIQNNYIHRLSVGAGQSWLELTGDKLPAFRNHVTALVLYAEIWGELAAALGTPFDKEEFLKQCFREMAEQSGLRGDDEMKATYMELEAEQARQRLAAIAGTYKA